MTKKSNLSLAIIGGGLTGLSAAIRAAEQGFDVDLFESSPQLGGRTRSFFHTPTQSWVDHGPHLLIGAYQHSQALLKQAGASHDIQWQDSLCLPLWEAQRGNFSLRTSPYLPFPMALMKGVFQMPEHGWQTLPSLLRLAISMQKKPQGSVFDWLNEQNIHPRLQQDMLEVLCLGAMNEPIHTAHADSFSELLKQAFTNHKQARLGWFKRPLNQALIAPLEALAKKLGVNIHTSCRVLELQTIASKQRLITRHKHKDVDHIILATSPSVRNTLLHMKQDIACHSITNIHLWFKENIKLSQPFIGGIGTFGQWFFDISRQFNENNIKTHHFSHLCAVISANQSPKTPQQQVHQVCRELQSITGKALTPAFQKIITIKQATHLVRPYADLQLPRAMIDACEQPKPGELPATIETAIIRGEQAVVKLLHQRDSNA